MKIVTLVANRPPHANLDDFRLYRYANVAPVAGGQTDIFAVDLATGNIGPFVARVQFHEWNNYLVEPPFPVEKIARMEWFIAGYFHYHDLHKDDDMHLLYFHWVNEAPNRRLRVLISP